MKPIYALQLVFAILVLGFVISCIPSAPPISLTNTGIETIPSSTYTDNSTLTFTPTPTPIIFTGLKTGGPYLVYFRDSGTGLELVISDSDGMGRRIYPYPGSDNGGLSLPDIISPNGKWAVLHTGTAGDCFGYVGEDTADLALNLIDLSTGQTKLITLLLSEDYPNNFNEAMQYIYVPDIQIDLVQAALVCAIRSSIKWSPDGRYLAFAGQMDGISSDLYVYDTVNGNIQRLSSGPEQIQWITWSPDGSQILDGSLLWISGAGGNTYNVYASTLDGSPPRLLSPSSGLCCGNPLWISDYKYLDYDCAFGVGSYDLRVIDIKTGTISRLWDGIIEDFAVDDSGDWIVINAITPIWPWDGQNPQFDSGIYLINTQTSIKTEILGPELHALGIEQRSTSEGALFTIRDMSGPGDYYLLFPDGSLLQIDLNQEPQAQGVKWESNANKIKFYSQDDELLIQFLHPNHYSLEQVIVRPDDLGAFTIYRDGDTRIMYTVNFLDVSVVQIDNIVNWTDPIWLETLGK